MLDKKEIISSIRELSQEQNFYFKMYEFLLEGSEESEEYLDFLEGKEFKNISDLRLYFEG